MAEPRFTLAAANDLIFWGIHLAVVGIALGIVWTRLDATAQVMTKLVTLQNDELALVKRQTQNAEEQTRLVEQRELKRVEAVNLIMSQQKQLLDESHQSMEDILSRVKGIAGDVATTLDQIKLISKAVVGTAIEKEQEAKQAEDVALNAQGAAHQARSRAAAASGALAQKKRRLNKVNRVIAKEKQKNPLQRMFQPIGQ